MEFIRLSSHLTSDAAKLAEAADGNLDARVPNCPDWTVTDLLRHIALVYEHKVQCIRLGKHPEPWPPAESTEAPLTQMRVALGDLLAEFAAREPSDTAFTWYDPDQTVGFWIRRMAQETVIHRVDAEQAAGKPLSPIDDALALDGIDELLTIMVDWGSTKWAENVAEALADATGDAVALVAGDHRWLVRAGKDTVDVTTGDGEASATITADPVTLFLWLWRRAGYEAVTIEGDTAAAKRLYEQLSSFTS